MLAVLLTSVYRVNVLFVTFSSCILLRIQIIMLWNNFYIGDYRPLDNFLCLESLPLNSCHYFNALGWVPGRVSSR